MRERHGLDDLIFTFVLLRIWLNRYSIPSLPQIIFHLSFAVFPHCREIFFYLGNFVVMFEPLIPGTVMAQRSSESSTMPVPGLCSYFLYYEAVFASEHTPCKSIVAAGNSVAYRLAYWVSQNV